MKRKSNRIPVSIHEEIIDDLAIILHHLGKIFYKCQEYNSLNSKIMKYLEKIYIRGIFEDIRNELDNDYFRAIALEGSEKKFDYYELEKRYESLMKEKENK